MLTPAQVITQARALLGVRFQHQGRDAVHGLDCLGLLLVIADRLQLQFESRDAMALDVRNYRTRPDTEFLRHQLSRWLQPIAVQEATHADIILLSIDGQPQHLALLSDYPLPGELGMIHAHAVARKVVEHRYDSQWKKISESAYRLPQLML